MRLVPRRPAALAGLSVLVVISSLVLADSSFARPSTIAKDVSIESTSPKLDHHAERVHLLRVNLAGKHVRLVAASPGNGLANRRQTTLAMARSRHAIAGINANFFDESYTGAQPVGGLVIDGHLIKAPKKKRNSNFYVTKAGRARIGVKPFIGTIARGGSLLRPAVSQSIYAVNSIDYAQEGRITFINSSLQVSHFRMRCTVATATMTGPNQAVITSVLTNVESLSRRHPEVFSLVACGDGPEPTWLLTSLQRGDQISVGGGLVGGIPDTLVSGGRQLVDNGQRFTDVSGPSPYGLNPLTFGCVSANGLKVILGVVDGRWKKSRGMTYGQLTTYLITHLHCWDAVVFDGGGSSTMVARAPGKKKLTVLNRPSDGFQRRVATGLLVVSR